ncbi:MAG: transposase [Deltaproteobacteria bacterium]|nr:transposase [Deltaproteobacteria bacterium]
MPRTARLDLPGLLQHVIVRGIERRKIFLDDEDRDGFVSRFGTLLEATKTQILAWALIPNHVHLLLRTTETTLSHFMRRLLTGYAVTFNLRHHRCGHLFQNRYKSIVCEDEPYLLELVRYIHLNPLRAGLVSGVDELDSYRWCGHSVLLGNRECGQQQTEEVLARFGRTAEEARRGYRSFVEAGVALGRQERFVGGGLRRSLNGEEPDSRNRHAYDERILGGGEFVESLWKEEGLRERLGPRLTLEELVERMATVEGLDRGALLRRSNRPKISEARAVVCALAVRELDYKGTEVGRALGLKRAGVSLAVRRGEAALVRRPDLRSVASC